MVTAVTAEVILKRNLSIAILQKQFDFYDNEKKYGFN